jgi:hypothetical protein
MIIRIKKLKELPDALHPNNIEEGYERISILSDNLYRVPTVGERFWVGAGFSTSMVTEIIDDKTFKTLSSIYEWEAKKELNV